MITFERLSIILRENGAIKDGPILYADRLQEDLLLNSLGLMMLLSSLEQELNIMLDPTFFAAIVTVEDLCELLRKKGMT